MRESRRRIAVAFALSADAEAGWTDRVVAAALTDGRPGWLRELWRAYDVAADLDVLAR